MQEEEANALSPHSGQGLAGARRVLPSGEEWATIVEFSRTLWASGIASSMGLGNVDQVTVIALMGWEMQLPLMSFLKDVRLVDGVPRVVRAKRSASRKRGKESFVSGAAEGKDGAADLKADGPAAPLAHEGRAPAEGSTEPVGVEAVAAPPPTDEMLPFPKGLWAGKKLSDLSSKEDFVRMVDGFTAAASAQTSEDRRQEKLSWVDKIKKWAAHRGLAL